MARFRKAKRYGRRFGKRQSRRSNSGMSPLNLMLGGAIYGFARPIVANMLPTFFQFGPVDSDNVIIGGLGYLGSKKSSGIIKAISYAAIIGESANITSKLSGNTTSSGSTAPTGAYSW